MTRQPAAGAWGRVRAALQRARAAQRRRTAGRSRTGRTLTALVCAGTGLLIAVSAVNARGTDLRPGRNTDLVSLVQAQSRRNSDLARRVTVLREQVDAQSRSGAPQPGLAPQVERDSRLAGLRAVVGPAVTVALDDAPTTVPADGVDADLLVVHQQDIQAVVNALWSGGAEAMTIQGQRVISTTGVKCVGNTVVLHGIPYAPPYVISAMGDPRRLRAALATSTPVRIYQQYVAAYGLIYRETEQPRSQFPAHQGAIELRYATVDPTVTTPSPSGTSSPR